MVDKNFISKQVYRVFHVTEDRVIKEAFFEEKEDAKQYVRLMNAIAENDEYSMNIWAWEMKIEK